MGNGLRITYATQRVVIFNHLWHGEERIMEREGRTVVILGEPEGISGPCGEELISIVAKSM